LWQSHKCIKEAKSFEGIETVDLFWISLRPIQPATEYQPKYKHISTERKPYFGFIYPPTNLEPADIPAMKNLSESNFQALAGILMHRG